MTNELDCRGLQCPEPVARCRDLLRAGKPETTRVLVDNQAALENVGRFLKRQGYEIRASRLSDNEWEIIAAKTGAAVEEQAVALASAAPDNAKSLILITTETLGRGDDSLGARLMETFLGSLPEMGDQLWRVVLLNGGVKLAAKAGATLDHLKKLDEAGVGILVCGTCLNHYGLLEQKQVGETTNMMDIVTSLALADKVIRP